MNFTALELFQIELFRGEEFLKFDKIRLPLSFRTYVAFMTYEISLGYLQDSKTLRVLMIPLYTEKKIHWCVPRRIVQYWEKCCIW